MTIAKKIKSSISQSSMIRKMFEEGILLKKKYGADKVYDFSLGNPNVEQPEEFKRELINLAAENIPLKHGYMPKCRLSRNKTGHCTKNQQDNRVENGC